MPQFLDASIAAFHLFSYTRTNVSPDYSRAGSVSRSRSWLDSGASAAGVITPLARLVVWNIRTAGRLVEPLFEYRLCANALKPDLAWIPSLRYQVRETVHSSLGREIGAHARIGTHLCTYKRKPKNYITLQMTKRTTQSIIFHLFRARKLSVTPGINTLHIDKPFRKQYFPKRHTRTCSDSHKPAK